VRCGEIHPDNALVVIFHLCPACRHVNRADAPRCEGCGAELQYEGDTVPAALLRVEPPTRTTAGALWLEDLVLPTPPLPPQDTTEPEESPLELTLREVELPPAPSDDESVGLLAGDPSGSPRDEGLVGADPDSADTNGHAIEVCTGIRTDPDDEPASRAAAKAARRAAVRRARIGQAPAAPGVPQAVPEVLVLDREDGARALLSTLLGAFGFRVETAVNIDQGAALCATRSFAAVFVDIVLDGSDGGAGVNLCKQIKQTGEPPVLVLVSGQLRPVERVRATLAGFDGLLLKPVTRGDVARTLEACGLPLPADARRA
jgi:CheY-like chemotaxis protein